MPPRTKPSDVRKLQAFKSRISHRQAVHQASGVEVSTGSLTSGLPIPGKNAKERKHYKLKMRKAHFKEQRHIIEEGTLHKDDENWDPTQLYGSIDTSVLASERVQETQQWLENDGQHVEYSEEIEDAVDLEDSQYAVNPKDAKHATDLEDVEYAVNNGDTDSTEASEDASVYGETNSDINLDRSPMSAEDTAIDLKSKAAELTSRVT